MKRLIFNLIFNKKTLIVLIVIGIVMILNRYSILLDFLLGFLILAGTVFIICALLANTKALDKLKIMASKILGKVVR
ncbi:hypothetical protein JGH11_19010 [Dysgonomonas sp. Marseille-P4677]|uniref:hypothetical protein n=1 Tax=Dysgonomonas sp. Marseille-P4677 TaxID=2364790 RepID=UPI0019135C2C|nr:hypothetical protein [Dysgonomonas sp. Marseille-P4677]MBK5722964.1 hypothetical protein [Dysgonomonas sp. Marseille-P4677]